MTEKNRRWLLAKRPTGIVGREHFEWREEPVPSIGEGEFLVRNRWLSCDPAQRTWMEIDTYIPALPLGEVMAAASAGVVVQSKHPDFEVGELVSGAFGWQDYAVSDGSAFGGLVPPLKIPPGVDPPTALSLFGVTGLTAYFGLLDVGEPKAGETVAVSGAAGAVGSIVCQIAKLKGCRVVGIAGGARKCRWVREELDADDAIDYKTEDLPIRLGETCPNGVEDFFEMSAARCLTQHSPISRSARGSHSVGPSPATADWSNGQRSGTISTSSSNAALCAASWSLITSTGRWRRSVRSPAGLARERSRTTLMWSKGSRMPRTP